MKVLVTGATGFVGNHVVNELLKRDFEVIATSIMDSDDAKKFSWFEKVKYISWDLNKPNQNFFEFFEEPELMIHLAWEGLSDYKNLIHIEKNLFSNYFFVKNMVEGGLKNMAVIGTCLEYGMQEGCLKEDMITNPRLPYPLAKDTLRKFIEELNKKYEFDFKWIRLFYLYGSGQSPKSILSQLDKALENNEEVFNMSLGEQQRDYLPVDKVAEYIVKISAQNKVNGIINCCSGKPVSIKELVEDHLKKRNRKIKLNLGYYPYTDYEPMSFWGNVSKLNKILKKTII